MFAKLVLSGIAGAAVAGGTGYGVVHARDVTIAAQASTIRGYETQHGKIVLAIKHIDTAEKELREAVKEP